MLRAFVVSLFALVLTLPAWGAEVDPKLLVLQQADVPAGFVLDSKYSGRRSNELEGKRSDPHGLALLRTSGRITGYEADYDREQTSIRARVDLFRKPPSGASRDRRRSLSRVRSNGGSPLR